MPGDQDRAGYKTVYSTDTLTGRLTPSGIRLIAPHLVSKVSVQEICEHLRRLQPEGQDVDLQRVARMLEADLIRLITGSERIGLPVRAQPAGSTASCTCADLSGVLVQNVFLSGSRREGVSTGQSDNDFMIQLGPFRVELRGARTSMQPGSNPEHTLLLEPTKNPGFFRLWHAPQAGCRHGKPLLFDQSSARQLISALTDTMHSHNGQFLRAGLAGPSQEATGILLLDNGRQTMDPGADLVACVQLQAPLQNLMTEFQQRRRPYGQMAAALVAKLARLPPYLVPVGFPGTADSAHQWRISFSQHEYIAFVNMQPVQRACLRVLKRCKEALGPPVKPLKSYYLKTALMWLCEGQPASQWNWHVLYDCFQLILKWIDDGLHQSRIPCYFDSRINLLAPRTQHEMAELKRAVKTMQNKLIPAVLSLFLTAIDIPPDKWPRKLENCLSTSGTISEKEVDQLKVSAWRQIHAAWTWNQFDNGGMPQSAPARPAKTEHGSASERNRSSDPPPDNGNETWLI